MLFGKNSDRPAGEAQPLRMEPARSAADALTLAYITVPDEAAYAHIGSAPFWCWGYEFGVNEHSVAIGNEAQFTRSWADDVIRAQRGDSPEYGIIGMELVRLGLERGRTAIEALDVMTRLLEKYGQWGSGVFGKRAADGAYDNSYMIADRTDAWVLETSGREWVAREVTSGSYSISNEPSIRTRFDRSSDGLFSNAIARGWIGTDAPFDYAASHVDPLTPLQVSSIRQRRSQQLLLDAQLAGGVSIDDARRVLRDHLEGTFLGGPTFNAARPDFLTLCMHEHEAGFTWGNTAASTIVEFGASEEDLTVVWWTPLPPCVGVYVPFFVEAGELPASVGFPARSGLPRPPEDVEQASFDPSSYWWGFQNLLDAAKGDAKGAFFSERQSVVRSRFDRLEDALHDDVDRLRESWRACDAENRVRMVNELVNCTAAAVEQVKQELISLVGEFAPGAWGRALDPRWA